MNNLTIPHPPVVYKPALIVLMASVDHLFNEEHETKEYLARFLEANPERSVEYAMDARLIELVGMYWGHPQLDSFLAGTPFPYFIENETRLDVQLGDYVVSNGRIHYYCDLLRDGRCSENRVEIFQFDNLPYERVLLADETGDELGKEFYDNADLYPRFSEQNVIDYCNRARAFGSNFVEGFYSDLAKRVDYLKSEYELMKSGLEPTYEGHKYRIKEFLGKAIIILEGYNTEEIVKRDNQLQKESKRFTCLTLHGINAVIHTEDCLTVKFSDGEWGKGLSCGTFSVYTPLPGDTFTQNHEAKEETKSNLAQEIELDKRFCITELSMAMDILGTECPDVINRFATELLINDLDLPEGTNYLPTLINISEQNDQFKHHYAAQLLTLLHNGSSKGLVENSVCSLFNDIDRALIEKFLRENVEEQSEFSKEMKTIITSMDFESSLLELLDDDPQTVVMDVEQTNSKKLSI